MKTPEKDNIKSSTLIKNVKSLPNSIVIEGYETVHNKTNYNGQRYAANAFEKWINEYFIQHNFNMPLTLQHQDDIMHIIGYIDTIEQRKEGLYIKAVIPSGIANFEHIQTLLKHNILNGFSKTGWVVKSSQQQDPETKEIYRLIEEIELIDISLVTIPANAQPITSKTEEKLNFINKVDEDKEKNLKNMGIAELFQ